MASTLTAGPVKARLRPLYVTGFIHGFALWYAVEKLFMKSIGFSDFLITVVTITYIVVMTAANLPLGVLADRWSRKGVLYVATGALIGGTLICGLARGFWMYAAGLSVWGVFYACYAGTYDSVIYDVVLEETGTTITGTTGTTGTMPAVSGSWSPRRAACRWRRAGQELSARGCRPRRSGRRAGRR